MEIAKVANKKQKRKHKFLNFELTTLTLPGIIYFFIFCYLPMFGAIIAFKKYNYANGILGSKWVGLKNFKFFFSSQDAWRLTRNTVGYNFVFIILGIICAVIVALFLYEICERGWIKFFQTSMILPTFLSWVIVGYISYIVLNPNLGILNQFLRFFRFSGRDWYSDTNCWPVILTVTNIWKNVGIDSIVYYAALMGISSELYEAAEIDGANKVQQVLNISIPHLIPIITILGILKVGNIFRGDFGLFYQIPRDIGSLYNVTDVIDTYLFRGLRNGDLGITSAVGLFQSFVGLILVVATNLIVKKISPENTLF